MDNVKFRGDEYAELSFFYDYLQVGAVFHEAPDMARQALATPYVYNAEDEDLARARAAKRPVLPSQRLEESK